MGKNVAVFVDVANIFYAAKAAGVDIDYVTLLRAATAGRDLVRAYAYTGLDPENENQRNFHSFLARHGYRVVSKDIRKYGDGKVKANLDIELVVDMMKTARNLDVAIVISGDGDFAPAIRAVQEMGVRVEVISFRGNTSSDLMDVADQFTDITALAKVEKGSSRSGRRVATDDEDLSMTEVPDKQTEGSGGRSRGGRGGRGRGRAAEAEPVAQAAGERRRLTLLPGEKLSGPAAAAGDDVAELEPVAADDADVTEEGATAEFEGSEARRRRRRRGGRGRGRGRGRGEETQFEVASAAEPRASREVEPEDDYVPPVRAPRPTPFGSVWDSQIGVPVAGPVESLEPLDDEDLDEPEIPEYLLAEQRRSRGPRGGQRGGQRGGARGAYAAAMERERYGRGGGGGLNRYPDVSGRSGGRQQPERRRDERPAGPRPDRPPRSSEPWSEVPPELEELVRAQLAGSGRSEPRGGRRAIGEASSPAPEPIAAGEPDTEIAPPADAPRRRAPARRKAAEPAESPEQATSSVAETPAATPRRRTTRRAAAADVTPVAEATGADAEPAVPAAEPAAPTAAEAPKRRAPARRKTAAAVRDDAASAEPAAETPKRRVTRRKNAEPATEPADA